MRSSHNRGGFTLIELLVVIAILGLLATMLMPAVTGANDSAIKTTDANNLKQLMNMYIKHRTDTRQTWAYPAHVGPTTGTGGLTQFSAADVADDDVAEDVTYSSFWELSRKHEISPDLFNSPAAEPTLDKLAGIGLADHKDATETAAAVTTWTGGAQLSYMLDWSAPKTAGTIRPTLSNRDAFNLFEEHINVVFADAHIGSAKDFDMTDGSRVVHLAVSSGSSGNEDDILTPTNDTVGSGSSAGTKEYFMGRGHRKRADMK